MGDIAKIDSNFVVEKKINKDDVNFFSVDEKPFKLYGVFKENGMYRRMPEAVAKTVSEMVYVLHTNTTGGRVRFVTDSPYVAVRASLMLGHGAVRSTFVNIAGFDLYVDNRFVKPFVPPSELMLPPYDVPRGYESVLELGEKKMREITIIFPSFSDVLALEIGLQEGAVIKESAPYKNEKPIVYYGSSITHGGCASRPGMTYEAIISREFDYDFVNLGFSGNAKAEDEIAEYIAGLDMSLFVYDYDHNAPSVEHLKNTHEKMFKKIRAKNPDLPIIIMPRPKYYLDEEEMLKGSIIRATYENAMAGGDKNVYFIESRDLTELCKDSGTVDGTHPTDLGFLSIAKALGKVVAEISIC